MRSALSHVPTRDVPLLHVFIIHDRGDLSILPARCQSDVCNGANVQQLSSLQPHPDMVKSSCQSSVRTQRDKWRLPITLRCAKLTNGLQS